MIYVIARFLNVQKIILSFHSIGLLLYGKYCICFLGVINFIFFIFEFSMSIALCVEMGNSWFHSERGDQCYLWSILATLSFSLCCLVGMQPLVIWFCIVQCSIFSFRYVNGTKIKWWFSKFSNGLWPIQNGPRWIQIAQQCVVSRSRDSLSSFRVFIRYVQREITQILLKITLIKDNDR